MQDWMKNAPPKPEGDPSLVYMGRADLSENPDRGGKVTWEAMWLADNGEWRGQVFRLAVDLDPSGLPTFGGRRVVDDRAFVRNASALSTVRAAFIERNTRADAMEGHYRPEQVQATRDGRS